MVIQRGSSFVMATHQAIWYETHFYWVTVIQRDMEININLYREIFIDHFAICKHWSGFSCYLFIQLFFYPIYSI